MAPVYAGITTTLSVGIANASTANVSLTNVGNPKVNIGDYLAIDDEIVRVKTTPTSTRQPTHSLYSVVYLEQTLRLTMQDLLFVGSRFHSQSNLESILTSEQRVTLGNTLDLVLVTTLLHFLSTRIAQNRPRQSLAFMRKDGGGNFFSGVDERGFTFSGHTKSNSVTVDIP